MYKFLSPVGSMQTFVLHLIHRAKNAREHAQEHFIIVEYPLGQVPGISNHTYASFSGGAAMTRLGSHG